ncbi:tRNA modification GTPase TrmE [Orientia chuto str. Dubai]|uniref:tRNA modification GTPase MnmE n=1 Tax=Orientia chuto str. Dubai TaxID=1359168 RepID=A0A0F3MLA7_9RICK|nr:tRNA uridine-5-carboxymethylaminomethyl(34) synthesis GTPase MnmE [Candidatus Orientia mediorientalis]KJV56446.1 tRNA modification GTPase TrmE [Orientia chuto str. Dubai]
MTSETIFAQSSAKGKAGVAIFRVSGNLSLLIVERLCGKFNIIPRRVYYRTIRCHITKQVIDKALIVYFQGKQSFTGEDVIEIHTHGSIAVAKMLTKCILEFEGVRLAEPGEFARRAFLNGKMDLTMAEGLVDLIESETLMQHKQAIRQMEGELEKLYSYWRRMLIKIISLVEGYIDFPDEEIPQSVLEDAESIIARLTKEISNHLGDARKGQMLRHGIVLTITGETNTGKSSLLNYLTMKEAAIVSDIPGTTRDVIEAHLDIGGYPIIVRDTAGIRDSNDPIEQEGIKRSLLAFKNSDIRILMIDATNMNSVNHTIAHLLNDIYTIIVINKIDLVNYNYDSSILPRNKPIVAISLQQQVGLDQLMAEIVNYAEKIADPGNFPAITRERYRNSLNQALKLLQLVNLKSDLVLAAEDLRIAIKHLEHITGQIKIDDILSEIFATFCIGK